jgi:DNA-binding response OmpR family regulator
MLLEAGAVILTMGIQRKRILVADGSPFFGSITANHLLKAEYDALLVHSRQDALFALQQFTPDLLIIDCQLQDSDGWKLYAELSREGRPIIMTSEQDSDEQFRKVIEHQTRILMNKPFSASELNVTIRNLLEPREDQIFGLKNYLDLLNLKKIRISSSQQIRPSLSAVMRQTTEWGLEFPNNYDIELVLQEMLTNAVYHSHGFTQEKERREQVSLGDHHVDLRFGRSKYKLGIAITDYMGTLSTERIYDVLQNNITAYEEMASNPDSVPDVLPSGRGLDMARKLSGEYYFIIDKGKRTEMIFLFDSRMHKDDPYSSIKIFELSSGDNN